DEPAVSADVPLAVPDPRGLQKHLAARDGERRGEAGVLVDNGQPLHRRTSLWSPSAARTACAAAAPLSPPVAGSIWLKVDRTAVVMSRPSGARTVAPREISRAR